MAQNSRSYTVRYGDQSAKFSSVAHAMAFASRIAAETGHHSEVSSRRAGGLIGQFQGGTGEPTPEFAHLARKAT